MFFSDYSEFLHPDQETAVFCRPMDLRMSDPQYLPAVNAQHDLVYSQFTSIISKRLISQAYPSTFMHCNPFCPLCLRFVSNSVPFVTCFINDQRNYLIHKQCLSNEKSYELRNVGEIIQSSIEMREIEEGERGKQEHGLDSREFYIELVLSHPINDKNFIKLTKKVSLKKGHFSIALDETDEDSYFPNIILLPMTDYLIKLSVWEVGSKAGSTKMTKYLTFKQLKHKRVLIRCEEITLQIELINDIMQKRELMERMNYKSTLTTDALPFVRIHSVQIALPQQLQDSDEDYMGGSGSTIVEELLNEKQHSISTIRTSEHSPIKSMRLLTDSNSSSEAEMENINLSKLISTNTLIDFVKNNTHSRLFQTFLAECSQTEIAQIFSHMKEKVVELTTHQYGNYMIQKLYSVCSPLQRVELLQIVLPHLCQLAKNKQGTHTIQAFVDYFTTAEEYSLVSMQIMEDFYFLCSHNNATHFIQKIVKTFPLEYTIGYFHYIAENLMAFALDKNAMCVVKHMMRRLRELEGQQAYDQAIELVRKQLILNVTFNVDSLIMDSFGNYVIQFCFELFDLERCSGITERILSRFSQYAMGKYSSNVLLKCISAYWTDRRVFQSLRTLSSTQILELFRNKEGNKILLEMMEKWEGNEVWDRLYSVLIGLEPTKYYHERWGVCLGCRSGQAGTKLSAFPGRKHYNRRY